MLPLLNEEPSFEVAVWVMLSLFFHTTVVPTATDIVEGLKAEFEIVIVFVVPVVPVLPPPVVLLFEQLNDKNNKTPIITPDSFFIGINLK
jgi:hypothetical protein